MRGRPMDRGFTGALRFGGWPGALLLSLASAACATPGATLGSGVGDRFLEHPPYYAGAKVIPGGIDGGGIGHLPVAYQRGGAQPSFLDPEATPALEELLGAMNRFLDDLGASEPLLGANGEPNPLPALPGVPPDVQFGCVTESGVPGDDCALRDDEEVLGRQGQTMRLAVGRPSREWVAWMGGTMTSAGVDQALLITLEVGEYWTRQRGWRGDKEVELGSGHVVSLPWLTSLETPVTVLQLTGALVGRDGKALRIGAEGLLARRTRLLLSAVGGQELITDEEVESLLTARREDLPGAPLVWEEALRTLVRELTGRGGA